jgi:hypothetical protein
VLLAPARRDDHGEGLEYDDMERIGLELGGGRIYGAFAPSIHAVTDFGPVGGEAGDDRGEDDEAEAENDEDDEDDDVALSFDNTLGSQSPALLEWMLILGAEPFEGLTLVELPAGGDDEQAGLRTMLGASRRHAEEVDLALQQRVAEVDRLSIECEHLRDEVAILRDRLAVAVQQGDEGPAADGAPASEALAAAELQVLRWRVAALEEEAASARARPVEVLEAELAHVRAELARAREGGAHDAEPGPDATAPADELAEELPEVGPDARDGADDDRLELELIAPDVPRETRGHLRTALGALMALVHRIERGGIGALELRHALVRVKARLLAAGAGRMA